MVLQVCRHIKFIDSYTSNRWISCYINYISINLLLKSCNFSCYIYIFVWFLYQWLYIFFLMFILSNYKRTIPPTDFPPPYHSDLKPLIPQRCEVRHEQSLCNQLSLPLQTYCQVPIALSYQKIYIYICQQKNVNKNILSGFIHHSYS